MEFRLYINLIRKWLWLLLAGAVVGAGIGFGLSIRQTPIYQTSTKLMVMSAPEERTANYYYSLNEIQLAKTYSQLINTEPVLQAASERLGFPVGGGISVRQVQDSQILEMSVRNVDPERAALIANTLIDVFIRYNEGLQTERYASSEQSLQAQIQQVEQQIASLQSEMDSISEQTLQTQQQQVEERIAELEVLIQPLEKEIDAIILQLAPLTPVPGTTGNPLANLSPEQINYLREQQSLLEEKLKQRDELQSTLDLYREVYLNLLVFGETSTRGEQSSRQDQLQGTLALYQQIYSNLLNSYESVRLSRLRSTPNVVQIEKAQVPGTPIQPQPMRSAALGAAAGLLIMAAIAFLIEYLDDTLKTPEDIDRSLGIPVIGLIGEIENTNGKKNGAPKVHVYEKPRSPISESFRSLRTNLEFAGVDHPLHSLLVTSANPSEGKTTIAVNLAAVMAQGDKQVILVDADLRRPAIHKHLAIPNHSGLSDIFRNPGQIEAALETWGVPSMTVVTSGALPPNPSELLGSSAMDQILKKFEQVSDIVIIDSPPFIVSDPVVLSAKVDGVLLVIEPGKTKIDSARAMLEQLQRAGARVLGAVLNPISRRKAHYYSGRYRYYSDYYYTHDAGYSVYSGNNGHSKAKKENGLRKMIIMRSTSSHPEPK